jgi:hypothetical protein
MTIGRQDALADSLAEDPKHVVRPPAFTLQPRHSAWSTHEAIRLRDHRGA